MRTAKDTDKRMAAMGYVSIREAHKRTSISIPTIRRAAQTGEIESKLYVARLYVQVASLLEFGGDAVRMLWEQSAVKGRAEGKKVAAG